METEVDMRKKYSGQKIRVVTAEIRRDGCYLITQRLASSTLPHLWEFPGGKVPDGESSEDVLRALLLDRNPASWPCSPVVHCSGKRRRACRTATRHFTVGLDAGG